MRKLLAVLGSIGLTSTAASAVVACGEKNNSNIDPGQEDNKDIIVSSNVTNGSYDAVTKTFTSEFRSSEYQGKEMDFTLIGVSLSAKNIVVTKADGTMVDSEDKSWNFSINDNVTTIQVNDYHLNGTTIQVNLDGYNSVTFKIVIERDQNIVVDNDVTNGSYDAVTKTFTAQYGSSQYSSHKMSFTINDLFLNLNNVVVKNSSGEIKYFGQGWVNVLKEDVDGTKTSTITINDYSLNSGTITIEDVDDYSSVTFNLVVSQDLVMPPINVVNGSYDDSTNTITADYGSSNYSENKMSFNLSKGINLNSNMLFIDKLITTITFSNGWTKIYGIADEYWTLDFIEDSWTFTIINADLSGATITIQDVDGYWPVTFTIVIPQD